jgi:hypothetical protein
LQAYDLSTLGTGAQRPRLSFLPRKISSAGQAAVALAAVAGLHLDPWQEWCVEQILGERQEMYYNPVLNRMMRRSSAYETALIVARQNGKGAVLEAVELAWLYILGARTIVHSAHEFATSREHFERLEGLITNTPELSAELARGGIKWSHGDESIRLSNDQRLLFKTRTKSAVRGFTIDKLVMDEAMILAAAAVKAMVYATSAGIDKQIIMSGSAGDKESIHFGRARSRGIKGNDQRLFFAEWSADICDQFCRLDCDLHDDRSDPATWAKANPGLGIRLEWETTQSEFLGHDDEVFNQERLSVGDWPADGEAWSVISEEGWANCFDSLSSLQGPATFSIDTTPDKHFSCIGVAGDNGEDATHIEVTGKNGILDHRPGVDWVVRRAVEIDKRSRNAQWVIDKGTQAGIFYDELVKAGLKVICPTVREYAQACGDFFSSVMPIGGSTPSIRHINQPDLRSALGGVEKRDLADLWAWDKKNSAGDISPLVACTNAYWGHRKRVNKPKPKPMAMWG